MNKQIKFRGKRTYGNHDWVSGYLVSGGLFGGNENACWIFYDKHFVEVIQETLGIHFGWADTDGTDIYTGDQLELFWGNGESTRETVSYSHEYGYFMYGNNPLCELVESSIESKVVGNIHDVKPAIQDGVIIDMNNNIGPKEAQEEVKQPADAIAAASDQEATTESAEEGSTEG